MNQSVARAAGRLWRRSGAVGRLAIRGNSMAPLLVDGDTVRVQADTRLQVGDVAVVSTPDGLVAHRLIARRGGRLLFAGDSSPAPDRPVDPAAVLGRVVAVEGPEGRRIDGPLWRAMGRGAAWSRRGGDRLGRRGARATTAATLALERLMLPPCTPEDRFLLLAARLELTPAAREQGQRLVGAGLDWDRLTSRAHQAQLGPLVYQGTQLLAPPAQLAGPALETLRRLYAANWARTRRLLAILVETLELLRAEGIPVLAHKGVAMMAAVYPDPALRIAGDIDLSVPDEAWPRAQQVTRRLRQRLHAADPTRRSGHGLHLELDRAAHHDVDPAHAAGGGHWQCSSWNWDQLWRRARWGELAGQPLLLPSPADLLLTLVANSIRRGFTPVRLVADMAATIARYGPIDWQLVTRVAYETRLDRRSWIALGLAAAWFDARVPPHLLEPPANLKPIWYERYLLALKHRRPFTRLPTRILWAGGHRRAAATAVKLACRAR